jgi:hypothetical protein
MIAEVNEVRLDVEHSTHTLHVIRRCGRMDRVARRRDNGHRPGASAAHRLHEHGDGFMTAIASDRGQVFSAGTYQIGIRTRADQDLHGLDVTLPHRKVKGLAVPGQIPIPLEQPAKRFRISRTGGANGVPDIAPAAAPRAVRLLRSEFVRFDQLCALPV